MDIFPIIEQNKESGALRIRVLREKIDNEQYLSDAIQRIALVLSNEIAGKYARSGLRRKKADERTG